MPPGFKPNELAPRYDVERFSEDQWHAYSGKRTAKLVSQHLSKHRDLPQSLLNAGSGVYELGIPGWTETAVDLFRNPINARNRAVQGNIESLPFPPRTFGAVVCVGEVLGYCDPQKAIPEFARVLTASGVLICDFGSTLSLRRLFTKEYGRAADLVTDEYNGTPERIWVYDRSYIESLLVSSGFKIVTSYGTHTWSALARRMGIPMSVALFIQEHLDWWKLPAAWADVRTVFAVRV